MDISAGTFESLSILAASSSFALVGILRRSVSVKTETRYEIQDVNFYAEQNGSSLEAQPTTD